MTITELTGRASADRFDAASDRQRFSVEHAHSRVPHESETLRDALFVMLGAAANSLISGHRGVFSDHLSESPVDRPSGELMLGIGFTIEMSVCNEDEPGTPTEAYRFARHAFLESDEIASEKYREIADILIERLLLHVPEFGQRPADK
jgi:hypothetical protein